MIGNEGCLIIIIMIMIIIIIIKTMVMSLTMTAMIRGRSMKSIRLMTLMMATTMMILRVMKWTRQLIGTMKRTKIMKRFR